MKTSAQFRRTWTSLRQFGLLLQSDARIPSVSGLVAGEPIRGSWWGHRDGHAIFQVARQLAGHEDVLVAKLISGKLTFLHRRLWPEFLAAVSGEQPWQMRELSATSRALLRRVVRTRAVRTDQLPSVSAQPREAVRDLESRLLIHADEVHTKTGAHAKILESWDRWATRSGVTGRLPSPAQGQERIREAARALCVGTGAKFRLPWEPPVGRRRPR